MAEVSTTTSRLNRAAGQVHALSRMIEEGKPCEDVLTQFKAAKAALEGAFSLYLEETAYKCISTKDQKALGRLISHLTRL